MKAKELKEAIAGYNAAHAEKIVVRCLTEDFEGNVLTLWANEFAKELLVANDYLIEEEPDGIDTAKYGLIPLGRLNAQTEEIEGLKEALEASAPEEEILRRIAFIQANAEYLLINESVRNEY